MVVADLPSTTFSRDQLDGPGPRSGRVINVPSEMSVPAAVLSAKYGDDIRIDPTHTFTGTVTLPNRASKDAMITGATPRRANGDPSDILITTAGSLPSLATRVLVNGDYPSGVTVFSVSSRVTRAHIGTLPVIQAANNANQTCLGANDAAFWRIQGIHFKQEVTNFAEEFVMIEVGGAPASRGLGQRAGLSRNILFDRCIFEADPLDRGPSFSACLAMDGNYLGLINSSVLKIYGGAAGDTKIYQINGEGSGPHHIENNDLEAFCGFFEGGVGSASIGVIASDGIVRRNYVHRPFNWAVSEPPPFADGWTVSISGTSVTRLGGFGWSPGSVYSIAPGFIMYDTVTGIARRVQSISDGDHLTLTAAWPGTPPTRVFFQAYSTRVNTGLTIGTAPTAITDGSATVRFSDPLDARVLVGHYFYLNDQHTYTGDYNNLGIGAIPGMIVRKIIAIDQDRLHCTLASAYPTHGAFPYSVVWWDHLKRGGIPKALLEHKSGVRWLYEGNIIEFSTETFRQHPTSQGNFPLLGTGGSIDGAPRTGTISGNTLTLTQGTFASWMPTIAAEFAAHGGLPWPYILVARDAIAGANAKGTAYVTAIDASLTVATLSSNGIAPGSGLNILIGFGVTPWVKGAEFTWRYNKWRKLTSGMTSFSTSPNIELVAKGKDYVYVHNVCEDIGWLDLDQNGSGRLMHQYVAGHASGGAGLNVSGDAGNGTWRNSHNTLVKVTGSPSGANVYNAGGEAPFDLSTDIELNDNVLAGPSGSGSILGADVVGAGIWTLPYDVRRNVFFGAGSPAAVTTPVFRGPFPDNAGMVDDTRVGFVDYANGNYRLADIYATGTVTLGASPIVFVETWPNSTNTLANSDLSWTQFGTAGLYKRGAGVVDSFLSNQRGAARVEVDLPGPDMYAQALLALYTSPGFQTARCGVAARWAAGADTCYEAVWEHDGSTKTVRLLRRVAGTATSLATTTDAAATTNDTIRLEVSGVGSAVSLVAKRNNSTILTFSDTDPARLVAGTRAGVVENRGADETQMIGRFEMGELVPSNTSIKVTLAGGSWPAIVAVGQTIRIAGNAAFRRIVSISGADAILDSNYPLAPGSGLPFVVTFKGTATDGTDPGANIDWVDDFTAGVDTAIDPQGGTPSPPTVTSLASGLAAVLT